MSKNSRTERVSRSTLWRKVNALEHVGLRGSKKMKTKARLVRCGTLGAAIAAALVGVLLAMTSASAAPIGTTCPNPDPVYGCQNFNPPAQINAACAITPATAAPGQTVTGTLQNVPAGTHAELQYDGVKVNEGNAGANGTLSLSYVIPANETGQHSIFFVGAGFACDAMSGSRLSVVLPASFDRNTTATTPRGIFALTGIELALYLAIAIVLLIVGAVAVRAARRRRRRLARQRERELMRDRLVSDR